MGLLGNIGHFIGHNLSEASHAAGIIPGIGPVVGGAMRAAGGLIEGDGVQDSLKNAAVEGIKNYGVGKIAHMIPGVSSVTDKLGNSIPGLAPANGGGDGGKGFLDSVGSFLGGNGGNNALMLAQGLNAAYNGKRAGDLSDAALQSATGAYNANAPLRDAGRAQMLHPEAGIAQKLASIPQGFNPYAQPQGQPGLAPAQAGPQPLQRYGGGQPTLGRAV